MQHQTITKNRTANQGNRMKKLITTILSFIISINAAPATADDEFFSKSVNQVFEQGIASQDISYFSDAFLRCGSILLLIDTMNDQSFGKPVFEGNPGMKLTLYGLQAQITLRDIRGGKWTDEEIQNMVARQQDGYHAIYLSRMNRNKQIDGEFVIHDPLLRNELEFCLQLANEL